MGTRNRKPSPADEKPTLDFENRQDWASWLHENHAASSGVWLRLAKKSSGQQSISYEDALQVALCYGWIDGQGKRENEEFWLQKYTPRGRRSTWSKRNQERVLALIERGEMQPAGLEEIERARNDGRWDAAYDPPSRITVPDDLRAALAENRVASTFFDSLDSRNRFAILHRIQTAKKAETREKNIRKFVEMLARKEKPHP